MTEGDHSSFWMTNHLVNPVLGLLLRGPFGRYFGKHLALVTYTGQRSDTRHQLIVQYARDGTVVWIVPGQPNRKTWWRNFAVTSPIDLRLAGREFRGRATAVRGDDDPEEVRRALATYLADLPRAAKSLGIGRASEPDGPVRGMVVVRVDLH